MEDDEIIELYWKREADAIARTKEKYEPYCSTIARNILYSREDSEECVNDTWLRTWNKIPPQRPGRLRSFVGAITRNLAIDRYRKSHAKRRGEGTMEEILLELSECVSEETVESQIDRMVLMAGINSFLKRQPKEKRVFFVRRYWYMDSTATIAEHMAVSESKVKTTLCRMRKELACVLKKEGIWI